MTNQPDKDKEAAERYQREHTKEVFKGLLKNPAHIRTKTIGDAFLAGCKHKEDEILAKIRVHFEANEYMDLRPQRILDIIAGQSVPLPESLALKEKES